MYAGFDIEFDRVEGIRSIPVAVGESAAVRIAALSHLVALALLIAVGGLLHVTWVYYAGCALVGVLLAWSDVDVRRRGLDRCLLYTSDAADDLLCVDLGGRRIIK